MVALERPAGQAGESTSCRPVVVELAEARLCGSGYPALRNVGCEYEGGTLTARGYLPTYYLKQLALAAVSGVEGVQRVVDRIEVQTPATGGSRRH